MVELFKEIWQTMRTNKLRTFLTGFSVAWGIFMLILLLAISNGVINSVTEMTLSNDPNRISIWGGWATLPYKGLKENRQVPLKDKYLSGLDKVDKQHISSVEGQIGFSGQISTNRDFLASSSSTGVYPNKFNNQYKLMQGRFINNMDLNEKRKSIVLHADDVKVLFADTNQVVGKIVKVGNLAFTVVGVYRHNWDKNAYIPYTTAIALKNYSDEIDRIDVHIQGVKDEKQSGRVEKSLVDEMAKIAKFDPDDTSAIYTYDRFASYLQQEKALSILNTTMWVIGILTLITGIVGVSNIMFVSVKERTHEIGIRRAIGAKPRNILVQIVLESIVLTTIFGYIGIVMGTLSTEIVKKVFANSDFMINPTVDISIAIDVTIALIIAGALAGIFPAIKSTKVKPVEALRDE